MVEIALPNSVRYVKNGTGGQWWQAARANNQIHAGWKSVPSELLLAPDFPKIEDVLKKEFGTRQGAKQDFNALCDLLDGPSKHIWMTFQDSCMWWCTVLDGASVNPNGESPEKGNFWLTCNRPWSNKSLKGRLLANSDLPGSVTRTAGFRATVCTPKAWEAILRIIGDERDPDAISASKARGDYEHAVLTMIKRLSWKDFEQLIDHILTRTGWARISMLGKTQEGIDIEAENLAAGEIAFVQVKGSSDQQELDDYIERFQNRRDLYARMIFAVHSGKFTPPTDNAVQVWTGDHLAHLVVRLGLGEWVETRLA
jgi:hypothetical protein